MSKCLNEISFKEVIEKALEESLKHFQDNYDHDTYSESYPYGDTYCSRSYIKESSWDRAQEEWVENFDIDEFVRDYLVESQDFRDMVLEMVKEY